MVTVPCEVIGHIMNGENGVKEGDKDKNQQAKCKVVEERVKIYVAPNKQSYAKQNGTSKQHSGHQPLAEPKEYPASSSKLLANHVKLQTLCLLPIQDGSHPSSTLS